MAILGLLLLTGGGATRLGGRKCGRMHPEGGTWGGHLVRTFQAVSAGPVWVLGDPVPDHPGLARLDDPREGPAVALRAWAACRPSGADRWWIVACDQVRWTASDLQAWLHLAASEDPGAWVMARSEGMRQYFGSLFPACMLPRLAATPGTSLRALADALPSVVLEWEAPMWRDIDTFEDLQNFRGKKIPES